MPEIVCLQGPETPPCGETEGETTHVAASPSACSCADYVQCQWAPAVWKSASKAPDSAIRRNFTAISSLADVVRPAYRRRSARLIPRYCLVNVSISALPPIGGGISPSGG